MNTQTIQDSIASWLNDVAGKLQNKMPYAIYQAQELEGIPYTADGSKWLAGPCDGICWWTNGFWPGTMWQMYLMTGDEQYAQEARRSELLLDDAFRDFSHLHHDVGFMWRLSAGVQYDLTGSKLSYERTMQAAAILAGRYNPAGFIRAWNIAAPGVVIIDCMMNLSLLYWASEKSGDPRFRMIAAHHADTAMKYFVREDGSCNHIVEFDPETLHIKDIPGGQGYAPGSSWSRGQGWAMYGFTISYRYTRKPEYLHTACAVADYFISCVGEDGIPASDFRAPAEPVRKDNIAGALAACALIDLSREVENEKAQYYLTEAIRLLQAMEKTDADWTLDCPAIFQRCLPAYSCEKHLPLQYGDFYFIEAVNKLRGVSYMTW